MCWLIDLMQDVSQTPLCIDSPNASLLARILEEGRVNKPGMVNSVNEEGTKCETIFPIIALLAEVQRHGCIVGPGVCADLRHKKFAGAQTADQNLCMIKKALVPTGMSSA